MSGGCKMVILDIWSSPFTSRTLSANAIRAGLFFCSDFEGSCSSSWFFCAFYLLFFSLCTEAEAQDGKTQHLDSVCLHHSRKISQMSEIFIHKGAQQLFTVRNYCKQWEQLPWAVLWEWARNPFPSLCAQTVQDLLIEMLMISHWQYSQ